MRGAGLTRGAAGRTNQIEDRPSNLLRRRIGRPNLVIDPGCGQDLRRRRRRRRSGPRSPEGVRRGFRERRGVPSGLANDFFRPGLREIARLENGRLDGGRRADHQHRKPFARAQRGGPQSFFRAQIGGSLRRRAQRRELQRDGCTEQLRRVQRPLERDALGQRARGPLLRDDAHDHLVTQIRGKRVDVERLDRRRERRARRRQQVVVLPRVALADLDPPMILERADGALEGCLREIRRALADRGGETLRLIRHARVEPRPPRGLPRRLCIDRRSQRRLVQLIFRRDGGDHAVDVRRARRRRPVARHEKFRQQRVHPLALQRSMREADRAVLLPQHGREQQRAIEAVALTIHEHAGGTAQDAAVRDPEGVAADPVEGARRISAEAGRDVGRIPAVARRLPLRILDCAQAVRERGRALRRRQRLSGSGETDRGGGASCRTGEPRPNRLRHRQRRQHDGDAGRDRRQSPDVRVRRRRARAPETAAHDRDDEPDRQHDDAADERALEDGRKTLPHARAREQRGERRGRDRAGGKRDGPVRGQRGERDPRDQRQPRGAQDRGARGRETERDDRGQDSRRGLTEESNAGDQPGREPGRHGHEPQHDRQRDADASAPANPRAPRRRGDDDVECGCRKRRRADGRSRRERFDDGIRQQRRGGDRHHISERGRRWTVRDPAGGGRHRRCTAHGRPLSGGCANDRRSSRRAQAGERSPSRLRRRGRRAIRQM